MSEKLEELIDRRLENLKTDDALKKRILEASEENGICKKRAQKRRGRRLFRPGLVLPLAAGLCLLFSVAVVAAVPEFREKFVRLLSPQYEEFAPPVTTAEDSSAEGNRMAGKAEGQTAGKSSDHSLQLEATNAVTDGKTMILYFQIQDNEGRLGDSVDVYDYFINGFTFLNCQQIGFDSSTNTAKFCILASGGTMPENGKIQLRVSALMTDSRRYEDFDTEIAVKDLLQKEAAGQEAAYFGGGGDEEMMAQLDGSRRVHVLENGSLNVSLRSDIDFVKITNAGYLDGYLHIQTKWSESVDNHGDVYLLDEAGNRIPSMSMHFAEGDGTATVDSEGNKYIEYVYDVNGVNLDTCTLNAFFVEDGQLFEGDWNAEFAVSSVENQSMEADGQGLAREIVLTPLGICLYDTQLEGGDMTEIVMTGRDGSSQAAAARFTEYDGEQKNLILVAEAPLDLEKLSKVVLNGKIIYDGSR